MTRDEAAAQLRAQADERMRQRRVLLAASVALATTSSPGAAIKAIREARLPGDVGDQAAAIIDGLAQELTSA
jgi:hypothetical protein